MYGLLRRRRGLGEGCTPNPPTRGLSLPYPHDAGLAVPRFTSSNSRDLDVAEHAKGKRGYGRQKVPSLNFRPTHSSIPSESCQGGSLSGHLTGGARITDEAPGRVTSAERGPWDGKGSSSTHRPRLHRNPRSTQFRRRRSFPHMSQGDLPRIPFSTLSAGVASVCIRRACHVFGLGSGGADEEEGAQQTGEGEGHSMMPI